MRTILTAVCGFTVLASGWLFTMYLILGHPGFQWRAAAALGFAAIGLITLTTVRARHAGTGLLTTAGLGAVVLAGVGIWAIATNVDDGFNDVIGAAFIVQAALTVSFLLRAAWPRRPSSPAHS
jgi:hypothetical protein